MNNTTSNKSLVALSVKQRNLANLQAMLTTETLEDLIPSSSQVANKVSVRVLDGKATQQRHVWVDGIFVGTEGLILVWEWEQRSNCSEFVPKRTTRFPAGRRTLVEIRPGYFDSDLIV